MPLLPRIFSRSVAMAATEPALKRVPIPRRGVDYRGKVVLAPMVRSGELPCRLLALHYGADLVWGPETVDWSMIGTTRRTNPATNTIEWTRSPSYGHTTSQQQDHKKSVMFKLHPELEGKRFIFQIGSSDPARAVEVARMVGADVAGIDVNAGCPKPFSLSGGMGAVLLRDPDRLCGILEALVREMTAPPYEIGVSVKIRVLPDPVETEALVRRLVATGITGLTVHCRTPTMRPREAAIRGQLRMVANLCREAGVACLMNGDVTDREAGVRLAAEFGADGAMIATAAERNPSCFRTAVEGGLAPWDEVAARYLRFALDTHNNFGNTKYCLTNVIPGRQPQYKPVSASKTCAELCHALSLPVDLMDQARTVDSLLLLDKPPEQKQRKQKAKPKQQGRLNTLAAAAGNTARVSKPNSAKLRKPLAASGLASPLLAAAQSSLDCV